MPGLLLRIKGDKMCERGRALSVFATIYLLYFSCLQVILYDIYIAKTIAISQRNIANRAKADTMEIWMPETQAETQIETQSEAQGGRIVPGGKF